MSLINGQNIDESDYIDESERNATPSNDAGRVPKLEGDGRLHPFFTRLGTTELDAGETLSGGTTPVPVYQNKTDNELYACDANDTDKLRFIGFVTSNGTDGNPVAFHGGGIVGGFSSLQEGEKYYVQDTVGTIGTTPGTNEVLVGVAISTTQLLIMRGRRRASGTATFSSTTTSTITLGFRPTSVRVHAVSPSGPVSVSFSNGGWTAAGGNRCVYYGSDGGSDYQAGADTTKAWRTAVDDINLQNTGVIDNVTDTGFRLNNTRVSDSVHVFWEAEGEL